LIISWFFILLVNQSANCSLTLMEVWRFSFRWTAPLHKMLSCLCTCDK